jgi:hypothetical protein
VRFILALTVLFLALSVRAQDWPGTRSRGRIPAPGPEVLLALDSVAQVEADDIVVISSRLRSCSNSEPESPNRAQKAIAAYFAAYYHDNHVFVLGRVPIGPGFTGYLLQVPGEYSLTVIDFWIYDSNRRNWLKPVELSEHWGDAGEYYYADALLLDFNRDGYKDVVKRGTRGWHDMGVGSPARVTFDVTVIRTFFRNGFRESGPAPQRLKDKLVAIDASPICN